MPMSRARIGLVQQMSRTQCGGAQKALEVAQARHVEQGEGVVGEKPPHQAGLGGLSRTCQDHGGSSRRTLPQQGLDVALDPHNMQQERLESRDC